MSDSLPPVPSAPSDRARTDPPDGPSDIKAICPDFRLLLLCFACSSRSVSARTVISGTVRSAKTQLPPGSVNVMLQSPSRQAMYGYAITGEAYALSYDVAGSADVTGRMIRQCARPIERRAAAEGG